MKKITSPVMVFFFPDQLIAGESEQMSSIPIRSSSPILGMKTKFPPRRRLQSRVPKASVTGGFQSSTLAPSIAARDEPNVQGVSAGMSN